MFAGNYTAAAAAVSSSYISIYRQMSDVTIKQMTTVTHAARTRIPLLRAQLNFTNVYIILLLLCVTERHSHEGLTVTRWYIRLE